MEYGLYEIMIACIAVLALRDLRRAVFGWSIRGFSQ